WRARAAAPRARACGAAGDDPLRAVGPVARPGPGGDGGPPHLGLPVRQAARRLVPGAEIALDPRRQRRRRRGPVPRTGVERRGAHECPRGVRPGDRRVRARPGAGVRQGFLGDVRSAAAFARMKRTARLINVGRGAIVDEAALLGALRSKRIAGAALDVFSVEPLPRRHPLWRLPGVLVSPHMSGDFVGWAPALSALFVENYLRWRRGEPLLNVVDKALGYVPGAAGESNDRRR